MAGLLGTGIGVTASLVGSVIVTWQQRRTEVVRASIARSDEHLRLQRDALLELTKLLATGVHNIEWLTWSAGVRLAEAFAAEVREYDSRTRLLLPQLISAEVAASSLADAHFAVVDPLVQKLIELDAEVSDAAASAGEPAEVLARVAAMRGRANALGEQVVRDVRALLRPPT